MTARRAIPRRLLILLLLLGAVAVAGTARAPAASAHATVVSTDPVDGSRLRAAPPRVSITFDESVGLEVGYFRVIDGAGRRADAGPPTHPGGHGATVAVALRSGLTAGTYLCSWRVTSADSHPVEGSFRFVFGSGMLSDVAAAQGPTVARSTSVAFDAARAASFGGLALLGGGWLLLTVWPGGRRVRRARRVVALGWAVAVVAAVAEFVLQGPYSSGAGLAAVSRVALLGSTAGTEFGRAHLVRVALLLALALLWRLVPRWPGPARWLAALLGVGLAATVSYSGHAAAADPRALAVASDMAHLLAMSAWVGGLVLLAVAVLPRHDPPDLARVLPVFSRVVMGSVTVLAVTGGYQAWRESGTVDAVTTTAYGRLVLIKVLLFVVLIGIGNLSRRAVRRRYPRPVAYALSDGAAPDRAGSGDPTPPDVPTPTAGADLGRLRRSVLAEIALAAVVVTVTGVLVAEPPGRAAATDTVRAGARSATASLGPGRAVTVSVDPAVHGRTAAAVELRGGPVPRQVTVTASLAARQLGPLPVSLTAHGMGSYHADGLLLPVAGTWTFTVTVRTSEFDSVTAQLPLDIT